MSVVGWLALGTLWVGVIALACGFVGIGSSDLRSMRRAEKGRAALGRIIPNHHHQETSDADHP